MDRRNQTMKIAMQTSPSGLVDDTQLDSITNTSSLESSDAARAQAKPSRPVSEVSMYKPHGTLRLFLALMVVDAHFAPLRGGTPLTSEQSTIAVMVFFVLSAYIITTALARFYRGQLGNFLVNRALRLFPTYFAVVIVTIGLYYLFFSLGFMSEYITGSVTEMADNGRAVVMFKIIPTKDIFSFTNIAENIFVVPVLYSLEKLGLYPIHVFLRAFWSLKVEIVYYLGAGLIAWGIYSGIPKICASRNGLLRDRIALMQTPMISLAMFLTVASVGTLLSWMAVDAHSFGPFRYLPYFLAGVCIYFYECGYRVASLAGLAVSFLGILHEAQGLASIHTDYEPWRLVVGIWGGGVAIWALSRCNNLVVGKWKYFDKKMGDLSYPVYLVNPLVLIICANLFQTPNFGVWVLAIAMTGLLAASNNRYVEGYLKRFRDQIRGTSL